jgi:hypothetical protein
MKTKQLAAWALGWFVVAAVGCAAGNDDATTTGTAGQGGDGTGTGTGQGGDPAGQGGGFLTTSAGGGEPVGTPEVFGHSRSRLYRLDPDTKAVAVVGDFVGCTGIEDIALDAQSNIFGTNDEGLYAIDKDTATCTLVAAGAYPNSLSFVPVGTVDANAEALVGYVLDEYVRIDPATGQMTTIGSLGLNGLISSGDIVSVKNGPTYLTVKPSSSNDDSCRDCLVEVDPATGEVVETFGEVGFEQIFGTAFWAGSLYGFTNGGQIFEITIDEFLNLNTVLIEQSDALSFWGAGSTTSAPPQPE